MVVISSGNCRFKSSPRYQPADINQYPKPLGIGKAVRHFLRPIDPCKYHYPGSGKL